MTTSPPSPRLTAQFPNSSSPFEEAPLHLAIISASVRKDRIGRPVAEWARQRPALAALSVDLIDLAECSLPDDELLEPGGGPRSSIADRIDDADGFLIVTPEYNHSYPASLKRAIDWHYDEWMFKPASILSYGGRGGVAAAEHLRGVFAELRVVVTRHQVGIHAPWNMFGEDGFSPTPDLSDALDQMLHELQWWGHTLRVARQSRPFTS